MKTTRILSSVLLAAVAFAAVPAAQATPAVPISGPSSQQGLHRDRAGGDHGGRGRSRGHHPPQGQ